MKLSINLKTESVVELLKKNISIILWVFLLIIFVLVGLIIFREYGKISQVRSDTSGVTGQTVRVNVQQHQEIENQFSENERFVPQAVPGSDSFGAAPTRTTN